jgi:glycosyltransferase involved in cell wall biosynthesis
VFNLNNHYKNIYYYTRGLFLKILHIEAEFMTHLGYQANLLSRYMSEEHEVIILSTNLNQVRKHQQVYLTGVKVTSDKEYFEKYGIKIIRVPSYLIISDRHIWSSIRNKVLSINPDVIFLHNNDTFVSIRYLLFDLKKINKPIILDSHMVNFASRNRFSPIFYVAYRKCITPIIVRNRITVVKTVQSDFLQDAFEIPNSLTPLVSFGSDIELFVPNSNKKKSFRSSNKISNNDVIFVYSGKLSPDKNGLFFAKSIQKEIGFNNRKALFIIIGNTVGEYGNEIEKIFGMSENRIIRIPLQSYFDLPFFYQVSDVGLIPYAGSLSFFDMQSTGLPVIWSDIEMNKSRSNPNTTYLFKANSIDDFRRSILDCLKLTDKALFDLSVSAREYIVDNYSYRDISNDYINIMKEEIEYRKINPFY